MSAPTTLPAPSRGASFTPRTPVPDTPPPPLTVRSWPLVVLSLPAAVAIWSGWVGLGQLCGFGVVHPLPGIADSFTLNSAVTLPIGMEAYAAYALRVWLTTPPGPARDFARTSAVLALSVGALGQAAYHLMTALGVTAAPWPVVVLVACLPVAVLGMGAALAHLHTHPAPPPSLPDVEHIPADEGPAPAEDVQDTPAGDGDPTTSPPAVVAAVEPIRPVGTPSAPAGPARTRALAAAEPGLSRDELAQRLGVSVRTVRRHLASGAAA